MADARGEVQVITIGAKELSLPSSSVHAIATGRARLCIDSLALDRLATQFPPPQSMKRCRIPISKALTLIESRASLVVLVNKLLRHPNPSNIRPVLPNQIADALNSDSRRSVSLEVEVTEEEGLLIENSCADLYGVSALIDHETAVLATVVDAVAALSCEALNGNHAAFDFTDAGDGLVDKDEIGVASDLKVLLSGSKMVGKILIKAISEIPEVHGGLRQFVNSVHSMMKVKLNSAVKVVYGGEMKERKAVASKLEPMFALRNVGASSLSRAKLNVEALGMGSSRNGLVTLFEMKCPTETKLRNTASYVSFALNAQDYSSFDHDLYCLVEIVWNIVSWELVTAFIVLEGVDEKSEAKKKKAVFGKGTSAIVQLIKDWLQRKEGEGATVLERLVDDLLSLFKPSHPELGELVSKVKEIVEKLRKGACDLRAYKNHPAKTIFPRSEMAANSRDVFSLVREMDKKQFVPDKNSLESCSQDMDDEDRPPNLAADWFNSKEEQTQFYAEKALESYNRDNPDAKLTLVEAVMSFRVVPRLAVFIHVNFKAKDKDGAVHLVFAETTFDVEPVLLSFCILEPGVAGDYSHHKKGCGLCNPESPILLYHPPEEKFKHGKGEPYLPFPPIPPIVDSFADIPEQFRYLFRRKRKPPTRETTQ